ncbi:MAG: sugar phosphate isomerase/epimerase [Anaerolineae bacterium]|nr:sugar phosphate isomerase/epimerase [Anaerolineae bacterium]
MLSITSDYYQSEGDTLPYLRRIAEAGFTHVHWCHHWSNDYLYSDDEIGEIKAWFKQFNLLLLNLHASQGREKYWVSFDDTRRLAGLELVKNRIAMPARLGGNVTIIHIPTTEPHELRTARMVQIRRSLDELEAFTRSRAVRMALENMDGDEFLVLETLLAEYDPVYLGLCFDSGHANLGGPGLEKLDQLKGRLIALHLHDNDGVSDQHKIPFTGSVNWPELARVIASSAYQACVNLEVGIHHTGYQDEMSFLQHSHQAGEKLTAMIESGRNDVMSQQGSPHET